MLAEEMPQFYFIVAQQPDIVNTAFLDGSPVSRPFTSVLSTTLQSVGLSMEIYRI